MSGAGVLGEWKILRELGSGGQGRVSVVVRNDVTEQFINPLGALIKKTTNDPPRVEEFHRQLWGAVLDYLDGNYLFGALKVLEKPNEQARARLAMEAQVYETLSDPHLLKILDKNIDEHWMVTEFQQNGTLQAKLEMFEAQALKALHAIRPLVN